MEIKVDTSSMKKHAQRLSEISSKAFPNAVKQTLNDAVYDVKTNTMLKQSKSDFVNRQENFFKANSSFERVSSTNVATMKASIGFLDGKLRGSNNRAVDDLEEQEHGGSIEKKSFIPMATARKSASVRSLVRPNARLSKIKNIVDSSKASGNLKQQFIKSVHFAGKGGNVLHENTLWKVNSITKKGKFKLTPLYNYRSKRSVKVKATNFMKEASEKTYDKLDDIFMKHAQRQFNKIK